MARIVNDFPKRRTQGRPDLYPWDDWFNGDVWLLVEGEDFQCKAMSMRQTVMVAAKRRNTDVKTAVRDEGIYVQAIYEDEDDATE